MAHSMEKDHSMMICRKNPPFLQENLPVMRMLTGNMFSREKNVNSK
jgi:hypothetical protein